MHYPWRSILKTSSTLALTGFKLRTEGSILGVLWYVLEPLFVFCVLMLLTQIVEIEQVFYPVYLFVGLIMFNLFAGATSHAATSLTSNRSYIHWLRIRYEQFPISSVFQFVLGHVIEILILGIVMFFFDVPIWTLLFYPLIFVPFVMFIMGVSCMLACVTVFTTDVAHAWRVFVSRLLWLGTPIFYVLPEGSLLATLNLFNPLFYFIDGARTIILYQHTPSWEILAGIAGISIGTLVVGSMLFATMYRSIPEHI